MVEGNAPYHLVSAGDTMIPQVISCFSHLLWRLEVCVVLHFLSGTLQPYTAAAIDRLNATHNVSNSSTILIVVTSRHYWRDHVPTRVASRTSPPSTCCENGPAGRNVRMLENISNVISY